MGLWVCVIIWCWWTISKWLWCIGGVTLATDSWRTETNLSHCHSPIINTSLNDLGVNPDFWTERLLPHYLSFFIILCFDQSYEFNEDHKSCLQTHKLLPNRNKAVGLPLAQLFSVHSLRMHKHYNALHCHSHTALRNWWYTLHHISQNFVLFLDKNTQVTLYIYCIHSATQ